MYFTQNNLNLHYTNPQDSKSKLFSALDSLYSNFEDFTIERNQKGNLKFHSKTALSNEVFEGIAKIGTYYIVPSDYDLRKQGYIFTIGFLKLFD